MSANVSWSMDFVADGLIGGRRLRCLTIVDDCTRECLAIEVDTSITGLRVQGVLERLADSRGLPALITVDNGPEFDVPNDGQVVTSYTSPSRSSQVIVSFIACSVVTLRPSA